MNDSINYRNFIDLLLNSDDEFESYGFSPYSMAPIAVSTQARYVMPYPLDDSEEYSTWYGE